MTQSKWIRVRTTDEQIAGLHANADRLGVSTNDFARTVARFDVSTNALVRSEADYALTAVDSLGLLQIRSQFARWSNHREQYFRVLDWLVASRVLPLSLTEETVDSAYAKLVHLDSLQASGRELVEAIREFALQPLGVFHKGKPRTFVFRADAETADSLSRNCAKLGVSKSDYVRGFCAVAIEDESLLEDYYDANLVYVDCDSLRDLIELIRSTGYLFDDALHDMNTLRAAQNMSYNRAVSLCEHADGQLGKAAARDDEIWRRLNRIGIAMQEGFVVLPIVYKPKAA